MNTIKNLGLAALSLISITSCLEGGDNQSTGTTIGVVEYSTKVGGNVVYINSNEFFYASTVANDPSIKHGDCCYLNYSLNYDAPENADAYSRGYYTVDAGGYTNITQHTTSPYVLDTATLLTTESRIYRLDNDEPNKSWGLIRNKLFINLYHMEVLTGLKYDLQLTYDGGAEPTTDLDGSRIYELYLRMTVTDEGKSPQTNIVDTRAFDVEQFITQMAYKEEYEKNKFLYFRINYIYDIDDETNKPKWTKTAPYIYAIPTED